MPYVPAPMAPTTDYRIGAHYFPGWKPGTHWGWQRLAEFPERTPLLGYYDESNPEVTDWEISWAVQHGISYFVYCWYREKDNVGRRMTDAGHRLGHAIHDGLFRARYGNRMEFAIMWECHNAGVAENEADLLDNLLLYWIDTYFGRPNYLRINGVPVLFIYCWYALERIAAPFGGPERLPYIFDRMRDIARDRGLGGLTIGLEYRDYSPEDVRRIRTLGADFVFTYCWHTAQQYPTADEAIARQLSGLRNLHETAALPYMVTPSVGWDPMPWRTDTPEKPWMHADKMTRWKLSPEDYRRLLAEVKAFMDNESTDNLAHRMLLLDNWNEWGEGHYLAPQATDGFAYLQAVRDTFTRRDNRPDYRLPRDLGLGPYEAETVG